MKTDAVVAPIDFSFVANWVPEVNRLFVHHRSRTLAHTLALAKVMWAARSRLPRGHWSAVWATDEMPFCKRQGDMLVTIGRQWEDLNEQTFAQMPLPAGWSILYLLAQLDRKTLLDHIRTGKIYRALKWDEARELLDAFKGRRRGQKRLQSEVKLRLRQFCKFFKATSEKWSLAERELARVKLAEMVEKLAAGARSSALVGAPTSSPATCGLDVNSVNSSAAASKTVSLVGADVRRLESRSKNESIVAAEVTRLKFPNPQPSTSCRAEARRRRVNPQPEEQRLLASAATS